MNQGILIIYRLGWHLELWHYSLWNGHGSSSTHPVGSHEGDPEDPKGWAPSSGRFKILEAFMRFRCLVSEWWQCQRKIFKPRVYLTKPNNNSRDLRRMNWWSINTSSKSRNQIGSWWSLYIVIRNGYPVRMMTMVIIKSKFYSKHGKEEPKVCLE